jgi:hypothetical protein
MRDFQKSKVYAWERKHVFPRIDSVLKPVHLLQKLVDYMWAEIGRENPPRVFIETRYKTKSTGNRYDIRLMDSMRDEHTVVHELGHSLNLCEDRGVYDSHGPNFVADYAYLLCRFYGFDKFEILYTLKKERVKINEKIFFGHFA